MVVKGNSRKPRMNGEGESKMIAFEMGKVPPQAIDLEEAVLGAIMLERDAVINVMLVGIFNKVFVKKSFARPQLLANGFTLLCCFVF